VNADGGGRKAEDGARPRVAVVDYHAGNLTSLHKGLTAAGAAPFVAHVAAELTGADAIVVPGVGHFGATTAIDEDMRQAIGTAVSVGRPLLGICLGLQFLFDGSEEAPGIDGLGLLPGRCSLLHGDVKVPHVGWNTLTRRRDSSMLDGVSEAAYVYFTHSYAAPIGADTVASTTHGVPFAAVVERGRVCGVQFHPEKSGEDGMRILRNFVALC
jgi:imidazole glycerol-phosphate synthase subunit HisH